MAAEQKTSTTTIGDLRAQLDSFSGRLSELEKLKEQQEGTIKVKQEEYTVASTQIKVGTDSALCMVVVNVCVCFAYNMSTHVSYYY